jgi:hypothetical protein
MEPLTWTVAEQLVAGDKVVFVRDFMMGNVPVPKGSTAVVHDNWLDKSPPGLVLEPDDKGLRAQLNYEHDGLIFLHAPEDTADVAWNDPTPIERRPPRSEQCG